LRALETSHQRRRWHAVAVPWPEQRSGEQVQDPLLTRDATQEEDRGSREIDTEPRNLKPQAEVKRVGKAINAPSHVLRSKLGIGLPLFALGLTLGSLMLELMMAPLFP